VSIAPGSFASGAMSPAGATTIPPSPAWTIGISGATGPADVGVAPSARSEARPRRDGIAFDRAKTMTRMPAQTDPAAGAASLGSRVAAFLVDAAVIAAVTAATLAAGSVAFGLDALRAAGGGRALDGALEIAANNPAIAIASALLTFAIASGYFIWFLGAESRTPGMALFDLRIVRLDGTALGLGGSLSRWGAFLLAALPLGLGVLWTAFSEDRRGLQDYLAGTRVVAR
jgi:uncharacterized RDD family membrane protein YckC